MPTFAIVIKRCPVTHNYYTEDVYTFVNGKKVFVSEGYVATTRLEVIRLAFLNSACRTLLAIRKPQVIEHMSFF